jgi:hypothetical protein
VSNKLFSLVSAAFLLMAPSISAAKQLAVVVGNDSYAEVPQLVAGVNDARAMRDGLQSVGFDVELVENGTKRQMSRAFSKVESKIEPGDTSRTRPLTLPISSSGSGPRGRAGSSRCSMPAATIRSRRMEPGR